MIEFAAPIWFGLLPLPVLVRWLVPPYRSRRESLQVPFFTRLITLTGETPQPGAVVMQRFVMQKILLPICWVLLVLATAKPEWVGQPIVSTKSARDLMVAVDLSGSMETRDFRSAEGNVISRLDAVKYVLRQFVAAREHDRLGLILFGDAAFLQAPFTEDHAAWLTLLDETDIGMAGQSTSFGDAIGLGIKLFLKSESENRVLIVLTDGNDTGSKVPPVDAAKVAASHDIRIYTIAVGDPATVGEEALDIETLERVAEVTGGDYFQALERTGLEQAYRQINALEPQQFETLSYRPRRDLFHWLIGAVVMIYLVFHGVMGAMNWRMQRALDGD